MSDIAGNLYREKGIHFEVCTPQGHSAHGKVERKIRALQDSLTKSKIENSRCTATGWMTLGKAIEHEVNDIPIGYLLDRRFNDGNPVLRMLRPNSLKGFGLTDRAQKGIFNIPNSPVDLMDRIKRLYDSWYMCWATSYIPMLLERQKWKLESKNLEPNDVIYFKMLESPLGAAWKLGKVEQVYIGKDGFVRDVLVAYKIMEDDSNGWRHATVKRPVRECIKLFEMEDTDFLDNMKDIRERAKEILFEKKNEEEDRLVNNDETQVESSKKLKSRRSTELERLKMDGHGTALPRLRSQRDVGNMFVQCSSVGDWNSTLTGDMVHSALEQQSGLNEKGVLDSSESSREEDNDYDNLNDYDGIMFLL